MNVLSVVIPTFNREEILISTIEKLLIQADGNTEIILVDQSVQHSSAVSARLAAFVADRSVKIINRSVPNIPAAMNAGLAACRGKIVLFLDDDIVPMNGLLSAHLEARRDRNVCAVAGRVLQPWHEGKNEDDLDGFASAKSGYVTHFMGGNFSIERDVALRLGGFDENFKRAAYQFEAEFAHRLSQAGHTIYYESTATIRHLKASSGGTRKFRSHLKTIKPDHSLGAYYFIFRTKKGFGRLTHTLRRLSSSIMTRHHIARPWWIPVTLISELGGLLWAIRLAASGPKFLESEVGRRTEVVSR